MKKSIAMKWVKALRSGEYKQGRFNLKTEKGYCCLGVLCEISKLSKFRKVRNDTKFSYFNVAGLLPSKVKNWAGMRSISGKGYKRLSLSRLNDAGTSFDKIANLIEKEYKDL